MGGWEGLWLVFRQPLEDLEQGMLWRGCCVNHRPRVTRASEAFAIIWVREREREVAPGSRERGKKAKRQGSDLGYVGRSR